MGARYTPCIKSVAGAKLLPCPIGIPITKTITDRGTLQGNYQCSLEDICGFGYVEPNQFFRFILPIFLHGGVLHFMMNMFFQMRNGFDLERSIGWWRIAAIYFFSGIGGFIFSGMFTGNVVSVGCSGSLYGLIACLGFDILHKWNKLAHPKKELFYMTLMTIFAFLIGTLPIIDNFARKKALHYS